MPTVAEPQQQAPMTDVTDDIVSAQPTAEPQPEMSLRGGEEAGSIKMGVDDGESL
ncbi:unnamed protein product [Clonostachys byssicola]|uniref:Uncharacterized protein n=1 Tax=Clonostachys byssicola TaxID=160290 RepID=A0A9N9Y6N5_9HYPO|nr:unnamed protein product [Clonostachys byssicola]